MVAVGSILFLTPSLSYVLVPDLHLTPTQLTLIFTAPVLMVALLSIPGGALGDRYGIRLVVGIAIILAGVSTLVRAWISGFGEMLALACIFGIGLGLVAPNLTRLVAVWFPRKETGLAVGISSTGLSVGLGIGMVIGPYFGDWRSAFLCVGIITTALSILWLVFSRSAPKGIAIKTPSMVFGIKAALRSKNIWLLGLALLLVNGAALGISGNLPAALTNIRSISPKEAGAFTSLLTFAGIPGAILLPMISDRVGLRKPFIYAGLVIGAICLYFTWQLAPGAVAYALITVGGFALIGAATVFFTLPIEWAEIGQEYVGSASGVVTALGNVGGFLIPLLVVTPLMSAQTITAYNIGFLTTAILSGVAFLLTTFLTESGTRVALRTRKAIPGTCEE
jgi:NNP family nitrate/nitrite transporter-like MFS transporter